jgi:tRNA(His) 5'-end guanylyltransferase
MDNLGDRMKIYEKVESGRRLIPLIPVCIRLDGRSFSRFTKKLDRPYDERFIKVMQATTKHLVEETGARIGYTQSDEITLVLYSDNIKSSIYFDGKIQKMVSTLAATCSVYFNKYLNEEFGKDKETLFPVGALPTFDCRIWNVPNITEATNVLVWRELDATKNSVSMACHKHYSHEEMMNKGRADQMDMLIEKGINWNDYPSSFKRGTYYQRVTVEKVLTAEELKDLPPKHDAHKNPKLKFKRSVVQQADLPPILRVVDRDKVLLK